MSFLEKREREERERDGERETERETEREEGVQRRLPVSWH